MGKRFKAAAVLAAPVWMDKEGTLNKMVEMAGEAASQGARLVVFPETYIPYYPWWVWMGINNPKKLELFRYLYENALEVPGPDVERLCQAAARLSIFMVVGINERHGGTLYNSQLFIDDRGRLLGRRRKLMPTGEERTIWGWGYGGDLKVFDTELGKMGGLICYEHSMPLARFALYALGEEIHIANWPGANFKSQPRDRSRIIDAAMRHTAFEGQVFAVFSSSCMSQEEVEFYLELDPANKGILSPGGGIAGIVDPLGNYVAGPIENQEGMAVGEIDLDLIRDAKHMVDAVGHYARSDVLKLLLDHRDQPPVIFKGGFPGGGDRFSRDELLGLWSKIRERLVVQDPSLERDLEVFTSRLEEMARG